MRFPSFGGTRRLRRSALKTPLQSPSLGRLGAAVSLDGNLRVLRQILHKPGEYFFGDGDLLLPSMRCAKLPGIVDDQLHV